MVVTSSFNIFLYHFWGSSGSTAIQVKDAPATFLAMLHNFQDLSSLTRGQTPAPGSESTKFWPLENQGIPNDGFRASDFNFRFCLNEDFCDPRSKILTQSHSVGLSSVQSSSVTQSCPTLCDPMNHSTPGLPVHHQLPESTQTHVHWVSDAIQPSHPLSSPSPPAFNLSQHQGLFKCQCFTSGGQNTGVSASTSVLPMNTQDWFPLGCTGWISLQSKGLSRVFPNTTVQKASIFQLSAFFTVQLTSIHDHWKKHSLD